MHRHRRRPDQADLEGVDEQVVLEQRAEVVEPDEVRRDVEPGPRVREAEVDPAHERRDAEDHDRQQRRDQQQDRLGRREAGPRGSPAAQRRPRLLAALTRTTGPADSGRRTRPSLESPLTRPDDARTTSRGSTPTARGSRSGSSIRSRSSSAAIRARSRRAEVDRGQRRPGDLGEAGVVHAHERDVARDVEARVAQRRERADGEQVVGAEDRVGRARARAAARSRARPGSIMKSAATAIRPSSRASPHERRPSR